MTACQPHRLVVGTEPDEKTERFLGACFVNLRVLEVVCRSFNVPFVVEEGVWGKALGDLVLDEAYEGF